MPDWWQNLGGPQWKHFKGVQQSGLGWNPWTNRTRSRSPFSHGIKLAGGWIISKKVGGNFTYIKKQRGNPISLWHSRRWLGLGYSNVEKGKNHAMPLQFAVGSQTNDWHEYPKNKGRWWDNGGDCGNIYLINSNLFSILCPLRCSVN